MGRTKETATPENGYKTVYRGGVGERTEKKSRFIATVRPVGSEEEAVAFIEEMKKKYWDASHNCSAFVLGTRGELTRCSDDGEPGGTAGRPMLDALLGAGLCNVCVVVTRYFGGTLLGTGGLVRAYAGAVQEGLNQCVLIHKKPGCKIKATCSYTDVGKVQYWMGKEGVAALDTEYTDRVVIHMLFPAGESERLQKQLKEATAGRVELQEEGEIFFGIVDKEALLFER